VKNQLSAATETIELDKLPQRASDVDTTVKRLVGDTTSTHDEDALPLRELLGLDRALQRTTSLLQVKQLSLTTYRSAPITLIPL